MRNNNYVFLIIGFVESNLIVMVTNRLIKDHGNKIQILKIHAKYFELLTRLE